MELGLEKKFDTLTALACSCFSPASFEKVKHLTIWEPLLTSGNPIPALPALLGNVAMLTLRRDDDGYTNKRHY